MSGVLQAGVSQILLKGQFVVILYFLAINGWYLILLVSSLLELRRHMLLIADESRHLLLSSTLSPTNCTGVLISCEMPLVTRPVGSTGKVEEIFSPGLAAFSATRALLRRAMEA